MDNLTKSIELLKNKNQNIDIILSAYGAAVKIGKPAVPMLIALLKEENVRCTIFAISALTKIGSEAIPSLIEALRNESISIRYYTAIILGNIGKKAKDATSSLMEALSDENLDVRVVAAEALIKIDASSARNAISVLIELLRDRNENIGRSSAATLGVIGPLKMKKYAVAELSVLLKSKNENIKNYTVWALSKIGKPAAPALTEALKDEYETVRNFAAKSLSEINTLTKEKLKENKNVEISQTTSMFSERREKFMGILNTLNPKEKEILKLRFGLGKDGYRHTLEEVGRIFNVTRERIRQIENKFLKTLKKLEYPNRTRIFRDYS